MTEIDVRKAELAEINWEGIEDQAMVECLVQLASITNDLTASSYPYHHRFEAAQQIYAEHRGWV